MRTGRGRCGISSWKVNSGNWETAVEDDLLKPSSLRGVQFAVINRYAGPGAPTIQFTVFIRIVPNGSWLEISTYHKLGAKGIGISSDVTVLPGEFCAGLIDDMAVCGFRVDVKRSLGTEDVPVLIEWCAIDDREGW